MSDTPTLDLAAMVDDLFRLLRLKTTPIGMQLFERVDDMLAVPKIRRPKGTVHTTDQIVGQAARLGFTVGITVDDLVGQQCGAVIGLAPQDAAFQAGKAFAGVWFATEVDAAAHQKAMTCVPHGRYTAMAVSPLAAGRDGPQVVVDQVVTVPGGSRPGAHNNAGVVRHPRHPSVTLSITPFGPPKIGIFCKRVTRVTQF